MPIVLTPTTPAPAYGTDQLRVYNEALRICGQRKLSSLIDSNNARYLLDDAWGNNGVNHCLEKGQWNFARRSSKLTYDPTVTPDWGYRRAFNKPADWVQTVMISGDEKFQMPLTAYLDEAGYWFCDLDDLYVSYVSADKNYGLNIGLWPSAFADYVSAHLAAVIIHTLSGDAGKRKEVLDYEKVQLQNAKSRDASNQPTKFPAQGSWVTARHGARTLADMGNRSQLTG